MTQAPNHIDKFQSEKIQKFVDFLKARGSQILSVTNEYEVLRFSGPDGSPCIIYQKSNGKLTWQPCALEAYAAFVGNAPWRAVEKTKRSTGSIKRMNRLKTLSERDGAGCFFCGIIKPLKEMTLEHFVPISAGGPDHISNMALACEACNCEAGHMSVSEKLRLAMRKRGMPHNQVTRPQN